VLLSNIIALVQEWLVQNSYLLDEMNISLENNVTPDDSVSSLMIKAICAATEGQFIVWEDGKGDMLIVDMESGEVRMSAHFVLRTNEQYLVENIILVFMNQMRA